MTIQQIITRVLLVWLLLSIGQYSFPQEYDIGFTSLVLTDSSRIYKPNSTKLEPLHYRPLELDIWYPAEVTGQEPMIFEELFGLFEKRAVRYDDTDDFTGLVNELALYYVAELGMGDDPNTLLSIKTNSYKEANLATGKFPLVIYLAGFNGMGFENYKVLENLARNGYVVASIWSVGRYPGNMTNRKEDMMEQVYDAEFALQYLNTSNIFDLVNQNIGLIGCSWGGMAAAVLANRSAEVSAFISLDGTETHYFGEDDSNAYYGNSTEDDNDEHIRKIHESGLLNSKELNTSYLYFESGDKLDDFIPTGEFHYYKQLQTEKYYLRYEDSTHADFTCIPSILKPLGTQAEIYNSITEACIKFMNRAIRSSTEFEAYWQDLLQKENTVEQPFDISKRKESTALQNIQGIVIDSKTEEPLQYVNVGVLNQFVGTVTDAEGRFELEISKDLIGDTLKISMIGYQSHEFILDDLNSSEEQILFKLKEQVSELEEVVLSAKAYKKKTLGNKTKSKFLSTGFSYDQLGAEMGIRININKQTLVDQFNSHISYNRLSATSVFRLNFYKVKDGKPGANIMRKQILTEIQPGQTGAISIDLRPYDIVLEEDIIISLEWVDKEGENRKDEAIFFSLGMFNSGTLYKHSSQSPFKKYNSMGVGFNLDVRI